MKSRFMVLSAALCALDASAFFKATCPSEPFSSPSITLCPTYVALDALMPLKDFAASVPIDDVDLQAVDLHALKAALPRAWSLPWGDKKAILINAERLPEGNARCSYCYQSLAGKITSHGYQFQLATLQKIDRGEIDEAQSVEGLHVANQGLPPALREEKIRFAPAAPVSKTALATIAEGDE